MKFIWSCTFLIFISCTQNKISLEQRVINDIFIDVVGTIGYQEFSLLPSPPDPLKNKNKPDSLLLEVVTVMQPLKKWETDLVAFFENYPHAFSNYKVFLNKNISKYNVAEILDVKQIFRNGRYILIPVKGEKELSSNNNIIGRVSFSTIAFNNEKDKAAVVVTLTDGPKAGITILNLLALENGIWKVVKEEMFDIW